MLAVLLSMRTCFGNLCAQLGQPKLPGICFILDAPLFLKAVLQLCVGLVLKRMPRLYRFVFCSTLDYLVRPPIFICILRVRSTSSAKVRKMSSKFSFKNPVPYNTKQFINHCFTGTLVQGHILVSTGGGAHGNKPA